MLTSRTTWTAARPRRHRAPTFLALAAAAVFVLATPSRAADDEARLWLTGTGRLSLPSEFFAALFVQTRFQDDIEEFERLVLNPSIGRTLGHGFVGALGYDAHVLRNPRVRLEHRTWQQLAFRHSLASLRVDHRVRLEQRYIEGEDGAASRLRYLLSGSVPISDSQWRAVLRNEAFFDLDAKRQGPTESGFGETRLFAGLLRSIGEEVAVEVGYQLQYVDRRRRDDLQAHTIAIELRYSR